MRRLTLRDAVTAFKAKLEQDADGRFEVWQAVAPAGTVWVCNGAKHIRIEWMPGCATSREAKRLAIREAIERISSGTRAMTQAERAECGE